MKLKTKNEVLFSHMCEKNQRKVFSSINTGIIRRKVGKPFSSFNQFMECSEISTFLEKDRVFWLIISYVLQRGTDIANSYRNPHRLSYAQDFVNNLVFGSGFRVSYLYSNEKLGIEKQIMKLFDDVYLA